MSTERPVVYILGTFPQASQTFIAREVRGLLRAGVRLQIFALRQKPSDVLEPQDRAWFSDVRFAPPMLSPQIVAASLIWATRAPGRWLRALLTLLRLQHRPKYLVLRAVGLFLTAAWIARHVERAGGCRHIHAHFALAQTEVAMAVSVLLDCPFSFTAHAYDIYASPSALEQKMRAASVVVTCTAHNVEHLRRLCPELPAGRVQLVHHGVETVEPDTAAPRPRLQATPVIIAAGRLVEKKGFDTLIDACAILKRQGLHFECHIHGDGPLLTALRRRIDALGLAPDVALAGWTPSPLLTDAMARATVFAMSSRVAAGGDRDGIPNVVLEALSLGLPVVATRVSGIPEAIVDGVTGLLVEPGDPADLSAALTRLIQSGPLRERLGLEARRHIAAEFSLVRASARLQAIFDADLR